MITTMEEIVANTDKDNKRKRDDWEQCRLASRTREKEALGEPPTEERSSCFGCVWLGKRNEATVSAKFLEKLNIIIRKNIACVDPVELAEFISSMYGKQRDEINDTLLDDEDEWPEWPAVMILEHIRNHNTDPEMQICLRLHEMRELAQVALNACVEINPETKREKINPIQARAYRDLVDSYFRINRLDPTKLSYYSNGALNDTKTATQKPISCSGKNVMENFFDSRK